MATPALRLLRESLRGSFIGGLVRPGIDEVLAGLDVLDEVHVDRARGVMGPKLVAGRLRARRYDAALLLTNSFSTALIARLAGIRRRIGYERDGRGLLLTQRLTAPKREDGAWAPVPAADYYWNAAWRVLEPREPSWRRLPEGARLELAATDEDEARAREVLARAGVDRTADIAILNPGGNKEGKRWPPERFEVIGRHLAERHGFMILINGSPGEAELVARIAAGAGGRSLTDSGISLGALKAILAGPLIDGSRRPARLMVTNDTGPRHIAAAFGVPVVTLFGPTDHRWTTIPAPAGQVNLLADPTLPEGEMADDHPERCRVDRITVEQVIEACERLLASPAARWAPAVQ